MPGQKRKKTNAKPSKSRPGEYDFLNRGPAKVKAPRQEKTEIPRDAVEVPAPQKVLFDDPRSGDLLSLLEIERGPFVLPNDALAARMMMMELHAEIIRIRMSREDDELFRLILAVV